jgi:hypothetical protein
MTAKRFGRNAYGRSFGYVLKINPPVITESEGDDVEGIGWVPHRGGPVKRSRNSICWMKYKDAALNHAINLPKSA